MNNELKKQFENNVKKYEEIEKEKRNAIKETEKAKENLKKYIMEYSEPSFIDYLNYEKKQYSKN